MVRVAIRTGNHPFAFSNYVWNDLVAAEKLKKENNRKITPKRRG